MRRATWVTGAAVGELVRARRATTAVFVFLGSMQGTLASRMPALKDHAGLSDSLLGLALLGIPAGSLLAVQVTGRWIARHGSAPVTRVGAMIMFAAMATPPFAAGFVPLLIALVLVGVGIGLTDVAMNAHAVTVQKAYRRSIMSSFHGFASLGALAGALVGLAAEHLGIGAEPHFLVLAAAEAVSWLIIGRFLLSGAADSHPRDSGVVATAGHRAPWTPVLAMLAGVALLSWMTEHAIGDWSAVYFRDHLDATGGASTYGYAAFAACMVVTRLVADRVIARLGPSLVLRIGGLTAGVGLAAGLAFDTIVGNTIGCGLVGIGMAAVVPIAFTAAGNQPGSSSGAAVSKVAGVAFVGSLIGPPIIGFTADLTSLRVALLLVAAAALVIGVAGPRAVRRS